VAQAEITPEELALEGFDPEAGATVVSVEYKQYDDELVAQYGDLGHAIVQVGFPGKPPHYHTPPCYYTPYFHYPDGWRRDLPPAGDPRRRD
jgi:hypothetical protein